MESQDEVQRTFDKLRRCDYIIACVAYTMAAIDMPQSATGEQRKRESVKAIETLGWTDEELTREGWRREREEGM